VPGERTSSRERSLDVQGSKVYRRAGGWSDSR